MLHPACYHYPTIHAFLRQLMYCPTCPLPAESVDQSPRHGQLLRLQLQSLSHCSLADVCADSLASDSTDLCLQRLSGCWSRDTKQDPACSFEGHGFCAGPCSCPQHCTCRVGPALCIQCWLHGHVPTHRGSGSKVCPLTVVLTGLHHCAAVKWLCIIVISLAVAGLSFRCANVQWMTKLHDLPLCTVA